MKNYTTMIDKLTMKDYELKGEYYRIDECSEVIRLNGIGSVRDMPTPYIHNNKIYFKIKSGIIPFYMAEEKNKKFLLYELTYKTYNRLGF
jgi:hypothetical protein